MRSSHIHIQALGRRERLIRGSFNALLQSVNALGAARISADRRAGDEGPKADPESVRKEIRGLSHDIGESFVRFATRRRRPWAERFLAMGANLLSAPAEAAVQGSELSPLAPYLETPFVEGNQLELLHSNVSDFQHRLRLIDEARDFISCCFWSVADDETGRLFTERLQARAREGLPVTLGIDSSVVDRQRYVDAGYPHFLDSLVAGGINLKLLSTAEQGVSSHRKVFVVDAEHAIVGGRNIGDAYARDEPGCFLDTDLRIEGPAAAAIGSFLHGQLGIPAPLAAAEVKVIDDGEGQLGSVALLDHEAGLERDDTIILATMQAIGQARVSIDLAFAYFVPIPAMVQALLAAADRGVRVRLLTNSAETSDYPMFAGTSYVHLAPLVADRRIEIYLMRRGSLHSKFGVFDGQLSLLGSHNLWPLSSLHDSETNLLVHGTDIAQQFIETLERRQSDARRATPETFVPPRNVLQRLAKWILWAAPDA